MKTALFAATAFLSITALSGQSTDSGESPVVAQQAPPPALPEFNTDRILGVIPNFQTVEDPQLPYTPLAVSQKFHLFVRESVDPFTFVGAALGAGLSQLRNADPRYGRDSGAYADRFGAAMADLATQNFFSDFLLAGVLHEDPRYFRKVVGSKKSRLGYALTRVLVTKTDSGGTRFNFSEFLGNGVMAGIGNLYYPSSRGFPDTFERLGLQVGADSLSNVLKEFWPDIKRHLHHQTTVD